jgi:predicted transcriptional regulator
MTVREIVSILNAEVHTGDTLLDKPVSAACGSDLMSDVIAFVKDEVALLTGLNTIQAVRTAIIMDVTVIIMVRGKKPSRDMIRLAEENGIAVLSTDLPMFLACGTLYASGLVRGGTRKIGRAG